ncbi:hypothetical protein LUZ60_016831 [Juncus effusus]|nr:hypothetical protein LUZ60_016831 [Juncus effusus]
MEETQTNALTQDSSSTSTCNSTSSSTSSSSSSTSHKKAGTKKGSKRKTTDSPSCNIEETETAIASDSQTQTPSKKQRSSEGKHPVYHGVRMRSWGKWVSEIREPRKKSRIWLGTFSNAEMAARAHDVAAMAIKGKSAQLNFPELAHELPRAASAAPKDVQAAAALAAQMVLESGGQEELESSSGSELEKEVNEDGLFDLPDLLCDLRSGLWCVSNSEVSCSAAWMDTMEEVGIGSFRLDEPSIWDYC